MDWKFAAQLLALASVVLGSMRFGYLLAAEHIVVLDDYLMTALIVLLLILSLNCWIISLVRRYRGQAHD